MANFTETTNYSFKKPAVGADTDQWGTHLNETIDGVDSQLKTLADSITSQQLEELGNVVNVTPTDDQFLRYNGTNWSAETVSIPDVLNDLSNVSGTPSSGDVLTYDGSTWSPASVTSAAVADGSVTNAKLHPSLQTVIGRILVTDDDDSPTDNQILVYSTSDAEWKYADQAGSTLQTLTDVSTTGLSDGDLMQYDGTAGEFVFIDASAARTLLNVDVSGTDNSTPVTLNTTSHDYLTLSSQQITLGPINLTDDVSGTLPIANGGTSASTSAGARTALGLGFFSTRSIVVDFTSLGGFPATAEFIRYITYNDTQVLFNKIDLNDEYNFDNSLPVSLGGTGSTTASAARSALGVDPAGTDNSTDVTLTSVASNYLTISGQAITAGTVPVALGGTGSTTASAARTALGVDPSGTDNSTNVTLATVSSNYLTISGQEITAGTVPFQLGGTGLTSLGSANQVLAVNSGGTALEFQNQSGGGLTDIVTDTTPQLGGSLDVNGQSIVSVSAGNIAITPDTTGKIILDGLSWPTADGSANQVLKTDGSGNLGFVDQSGSGGITAGKAIALAMIFG